MTDPINAQVAPDKQSTHSSDDEKHQQSVLPPVEGGPRLDANGEAIRTTAGVDRIEAVARAAQNTKSGKHTLYIIAFCLWLMYFVVRLPSAGSLAAHLPSLRARERAADPPYPPLARSLQYTMQGSTTYAYSVWATSSFAAHSSGISTLSIATSIIGAVCKPCASRRTLPSTVEADDLAPPILLPVLAKMSDVFTRQYMFLVVMISCVGPFPRAQPDALRPDRPPRSYVIGFIMILKSPNLATYVVGSVFVSIGSSGLDLLTTILAAGASCPSFPGHLRPDRPTTEAPARATACPPDLVPLSYRGLAFGLISFPYVVTPWRVPPPERCPLAGG